jgi:hypothetical protein
MSILVFTPFHFIAYVELCWATPQSMQQQENGNYGEIWGIVQGIRYSLYPLLCILIITGLLGFALSSKKMMQFFVFSFLVYSVYILLNLLG